MKPAGDSNIKDFSMESGRKVHGINESSNNQLLDSHTVDIEENKSNHINSTKQICILNTSLSSQPISVNISINNNIVSHSKLQPKIIVANTQQNTQRSARVAVTKKTSLNSTQACSTKIPGIKINHQIKKETTNVPQSRFNCLLNSKTVRNSYVPEKITKDRSSLVPTPRKNESLSHLAKAQIQLVKKEEEIKFPMTAPQALKFFADRLTDFEKGELLDYKEIYFLGKELLKKEVRRSNKIQNFDDDKGDYNAYVGEQIGYRYEIVDILGKGSFGQALKCYDHKAKQPIALKIIRSKKRFYHQATVEVKILKFISDNDVKNSSNIVKMQDCFIFRKHIVRLQIIINYSALTLNFLASISMIL